MSNIHRSRLRQLERGQGFIEYALITVLIAVVAIPTVSILANPGNFREGAIYNNVYEPMLCVVQGREATCERRFSAGFPTYDNPGGKELAESGDGSNSNGGGGTSDPAILDVISITLDGTQTNTAEAGTFALAAVSTGGADSVTLTLTAPAPDSTVLISTTNTVDADSEYENTPQDTFGFGNVDMTASGSYTVTAFATKDGVDSTTVTQNITITDPNNSDNLFAGGFNLIDASADTVLGGLVEGQALDPGLYDFQGIAAGSGTPTSVVLQLTGPVASSANLTEEPYILTNETGGDYTGVSLTPGSYAIIYTPYDANNSVGTSGTINFTVNEPSEPITVDAISVTQNGTDRGAISDGDSYASADTLTFSSTATGPLGSVKYVLNNTTSGAVTELIADTAPYELFPNGDTLAAGSYTLVATPNYATDGSGTDGTAVTINFTVADLSNTRILSLDAYTGDGQPLSVDLQDGGSITITDAQAALGVAFEAIANNPEVSGNGTQSVRFQFAGTDGNTYTKTQDEDEAGYWSATGSSLGDAGFDTFLPGNYRLEVTAYSENGHNDSDAGETLTITFVVEEPAGPFELTVEAESGTLNGAFEIRTDSGRTIVMTPPGAGNVYSSPLASGATNGDFVSYTITVPRSGTYRWYTTAKGNGGSSDSFWFVHAESGTAYQHFINSGSYSERQLNERGSSTRTITLDAGPNTINVYRREDNSFLDSWRIVEIFP